MSKIYIPDRIVPVGKVLAILRDVRTGRVHETLSNNMVVTAGKNSIASRAVGNTKGEITYCAVGTGIVAPVAGNTALGSELARKLISVRSVSGNVATFSTFFTTSEAIGSLTEAGLFGDDATATSGTGTLFARTLISRTKTSNDTLTLVWSLTIG